MAPPQRRIRRLRFTLRTMLLIVLLLCALLGWVGGYLAEYYTQQAVIADVRAVRGRVIYEDGKQDVPSSWSPAGWSPFKRVLCVQLTDTNVDDAGLEQIRLHRLPHLVGVNLGDNYAYHGGRMNYTPPSKVTDRGLVHLRSCENLRALNLGGTATSDAGLEQLSTVSQLEVLYLDGTRLTNAGMVHLSKLRSLRELHLGDTELQGGGGLQHLAALPRLETLSLADTLVDDSAIRYLRSMSRLKALILLRTQVSDEGARRLKQALPNCDVDHSNEPAVDWRTILQQ